MVTSVVVAEELAARLMQLQATQNDIAVLAGVWVDTSLFVVGGIYGTETKIPTLTGARAAHGSFDFLCAQNT